MFADVSGFVLFVLSGFIAIMAITLFVKIMQIKPPMSSNSNLYL